MIIQLLGGYPKIAIVIQSDLSKLAQLPIGSIFYFKEITLKEAEKNLIKYYNEIDKLKDHIFYI
jgi:Allophanate hydrolase subunit 2